MKKKYSASIKDKREWEHYTKKLKSVYNKDDDLFDKNNKVIEGNPDTIKTVNDVWKFSKNMWSQDPTWYLVDTSK